ncbi:hypothetical protein EJP617_01410 [Erwinia sp. Ejp617]|nr:hypothetical protein [Erwinia sp. Ejp617]ADP09822.1 hypothetical protein EJP617_01410 [Erwinia sp. Ejp617]
MNRTLLHTVKSPAVLLFIGGFLLPIAAFLLKEMMFFPLKASCVAPQAWYEISDNKNWTLTRGIYRFYREGLTQRRVIYTGSINHYVNGGRSLHPVAVLREVTLSTTISGNRLHSTVLQQSSRLGDQSSNADVVKYVFPHIVPGETSINAVYLLDGKALAIGSASSARTLCIN